MPQENRRPVNIRAIHDGWKLLDVLADLFPQIPREEWADRCEAGRFISYGGLPRGAEHVVRAGERVLQVFPPEVEPDVATDIRILFEDEALVVVHKPAPLPMHSGGRFHRNTLQYLMNLAYAPYVVRPVHRLDANTTGLVLFARTRHWCRLLQRQFLENTVEKRYLVRVQGWPSQEEFSADFPISSQPDEVGSRGIAGDDGLAARTDFQVIRRCQDGSTLLEARLGSGRTNQIRVHLQKLGYPVCGDPTYLMDGRIGESQTLLLGAPAMQLHAWMLSFTHPLGGEPVSFHAEPPAWAVELGQELAPPMG
jgi:UPF0176 protein